MKISAKTSALIKSYWHAFIAVEAAFVIQYAKAYFSAPSAPHSVLPHFNYVSFAYAAVGAVFAPATRALVARFPWLSPLQVRLSTKLSQLQAQADHAALTAPAAPVVPVVPVVPAAPADPAAPAAPIA